MTFINDGLHRGAPIDAPNLDAMTPEDLMAFWSAANTRPVVHARQLFPHKPQGYVKAAHALALYASNKATAMKCRLRGEIDSAQMYEGIADHIYNRLPAFARW